MYLFEVRFKLSARCLSLHTLYYQLGLFFGGKGVSPVGYDKDGSAIFDILCDYEEMLVFTTTDLYDQYCIGLVTVGYPEMEFDEC